MKTAVVLTGAASAIRPQAGEVNRLLQACRGAIPEIEVWLFYHDNPPDAFPRMSRPVSRVVMVRVGLAQPPESVLYLLDQLQARKRMALLLFASDGLGGELATRLAFRCQGSSCLQVETLTVGGQSVRVARPAYGNHMTASVVLQNPPFCLAAAKSAVTPAEAQMFGDTPVHDRRDHDPVATDWIIESEIVDDHDISGLEAAKVVLAVGQGAQNRANVRLLRRIAASMAAEIGGSRQAVISGWLGMGRLIGASGKVISPSLCIAAGVSGAGAFAYGIQGSASIAAVNTDPAAPIFKLADVGIEADMMEFLEALGDVVADKGGDGQP